MKLTLKLENICKYYGGQLALSGLSFTVDRNETVGLLGLNGAGKTTLLRLISMQLLPSSGKIHWNNKPSFGFLPDRPPLFNEMKVNEFLAYVLALRVNFSKDKQQSMIANAIELTRLGEVRSKKIKELSHGFKQRVGIAQAIVHEPELIILDEPIQGLDPLQIKNMRDLIQELSKNYTVLLSSHILSEITQVCSRAIVLHKGKIAHFFLPDNFSQLESVFLNLVKDEEKKHE